MVQEVMVGTEVVQHRLQAGVNQQLQLVQAVVHTQQQWYCQPTAFSFCQWSGDDEGKTGFIASGDDAETGKTMPKRQSIQFIMRKCVLVIRRDKEAGVLSMWLGS
jgi:hypothetical protein